MGLMKEKVKRPRLASRDSLKPLIQSPSVYELYDLMHISSCSLAIDRWDNRWLFCPVCGARENNAGRVIHRTADEFV